MVAVLVAAALTVSPDSGNNTFMAVFDAPLGERITAVSSQVGCDLTYDEKTGAASGTCSVPLQSVMVDNEPTKTEHFQQWATNKKGKPEKCRLEAKLDNVRLEPAALSQSPSALHGEAAFTICGRAREDNGKETLTGNVFLLADGQLRIKARVDKFNREAYHLGPKWTAGWLGRVQQLAPVVSPVGSIDLSLFAKSKGETKAAAAP